MILKRSWRLIFKMRQRSFSLGVVALGALLAGGCGTICGVYPTGKFLFDEGVHPLETRRIIDVVTMSVVPGDWQHRFVFQPHENTVYIRTSTRGHRAIRMVWPELVCLAEPADVNGTQVAACRAEIAALLAK